MTCLFTVTAPGGRGGETVGQTCDGSPLLHSPQQRTQQRGPGPRPHLTQAANTRISPEGSVCAPLAALAWKRKDSLRADPGDGVSQRLTHRQACACTQQSLDQCATPRGFWRNPGPPVRLGDKQRSGQTPSQDDLQRMWRTAGGPHMCCPRGGDGRDLHLASVLSIHGPEASTPQSAGLPGDRPGSRAPARFSTRALGSTQAPEERVAAPVWAGKARTCGDAACPTVPMSREAWTYY